MSTLVECLMRLYKSGRIDEKVLQTRLDKGTITQEEYDMIIPPPIENEEVIVEEDIIEEAEEETTTEEVSSKE